MPNTTLGTASKLPDFTFLSTPYAWLSRLLAPCEDCWTWMTNDGTIYEEVEVLTVGPKYVTFRHSYGTASVLLTELTPEVQRTLRDHAVATEPRFETSMLVHSMSRAG